MTACMVEDCGRVRHAKGYCTRHYLRFYRNGHPLASSNKPRGKRLPIENRFWSKVDKSDPDGCWLWIGSKRHTYGEVWRDGKKMYAHRASYEMAFGELAPGHFVCHRCDTPLCVRPEHLFAGSQLDNMRDAAAKGRCRNQHSEAS